MNIWTFCKQQLQTRISDSTHDRVKRTFISISSALLIGFSDPIQSPFLSFCSSIFLYGLFFSQIESFSRKTTFWAAFGWYALSQAILFSWFATTTFHGPFIVVAYFILLGLISSQFGLFALVVKGPMRWPKLLALAGMWTLFEWARLFFMAGYVWNPVGLSMTWSVSLLQLASYAGVYGLSFLVMAINLLFFRFLKSLSLKRFYLWSIAAFLPFLVGTLHWVTHEIQQKKSPSIRLAAVQTGLGVEEKMPFGLYPDSFMHPILQWDAHFQLLSKRIKSPVDMIVFPESVSLFDLFSSVYLLDEIGHLMVKNFGERVLDALPSMEDQRFAKMFDSDQYVSNAFIGQWLSNFFSADIIMGFDDSDAKLNQHYNAAFLFSPNRENIQRYIKRVLVPIAEYLPFKGFAKIAGHYGIGDFFTPGEGAIILEGKKKIGVSICYEECFGHLMRENRSKGAELFVNLTNDGWFPRSKLPRQHFNHARLRSVEMGIPQIRASNTGFSGAINSFGRVEALLGDRDECGKMIKDIAMIELRDYTYPTLYAKVGDWLIVIVSIAFILIHMISLKIRLAQKNKSSLNS